MRILAIVTVAMLLLVNRNAAAQTKPSDLFFTQSSSRDFGLNEIPAQSIVAQGVTLRGWLQSVNPPSPCTQAVEVNDAVNKGVDIGYEDVHYNLVLDSDFINSMYGSNAGVLNGALIHGNPIDSQTNPFPVLAPGPNAPPSNLDINSFWLPGAASAPITFGTELNAWHQRRSKHCGFLGMFCGFYRNYTGRGTAPSGWIEKEYSDPSVCTTPPGTLGKLSADNWWPFNPDNPDGQAANLGVGDYVEVQGTLWQDTGHDSGQPTGCWNELFHNQDGWLEIHPVDVLRKVQGPGRSPVLNSVQAAIDGIKQNVAVAQCSDAQGSAVNYTLWVCPEQLSSTFPTGRTPQPLSAHFLELIDNRFSVVNQFITHGATVVNDCVNIGVNWAQGVRWARYKATYEVWWTPGTIPPPTLTVAFQTIGAGGYPASFKLQLDGKTLADSVSAFPATIFPNSNFPNLSSGEHYITVSATGNTNLGDYDIQSTPDCRGTQTSFLVTLQPGDAKSCGIFAVRKGSIHPPKK
jgi:hypothetical protein